MRDIDPVSAYGVVHSDDVNKSLNGLTSGARYAAADLYERYAAMVREDGRSPGHPVGYGQALARLGLDRVKMTVGGAGKGQTGRGRQISAWVVK
jgi:hypothetical protein